MGHLKLNNYTTITFENCKPVAVTWDLSSLAEWLSDKELVRQVVSSLRLCGWNVRVGKPQFENDGSPYSDYFAPIELEGEKPMKPTWETYERPRSSDNENDMETVHILNFTKGNRRIFCNVQITPAFADTDTLKDRWYICILAEFCALFEGTLDDAKIAALGYLPRVINEAKILIATYEEFSKGT